jgi:hypothetical protein
VERRVLPEPGTKPENSLEKSFQAFLFYGGLLRTCVRKNILKEFRMKKRFLLLGMAVLLVLSLSAFMGCSQGDDDGDNFFLGDSLENSVWVGETETADDWATFTFKASGEVVVAFTSDKNNNGDTAQRTSEYTYNVLTKAGTVTVTSSGVGAGDSPGAFELSADTRTLTFSDYKGLGSSRTFKRVRPYAGNTFTLADLPSNLLNTMWAGSNPMQTNGWITLTFISNGVVAAYTHDNTSRVRTYTYVGTYKTGNIASGVGDFIIVNGDRTLRLANMYGHGTPIDLTRLR